MAKTKPPEKPTHFLTDGLDEIKKAQARYAHEDYEARLARQICRALGGDDSRMIEQVRRRYGVRTIRLHHLETLDNPPPICFRVGKVYRLYELALSDLFKNFVRTPLYRAYASLLESHDLDDSRPLAMVFGWPKVSAYCCLHNASALIDERPIRPEIAANNKKSDAWVIVRVFLPGLGRVQLTLEPLENLLPLFRELC